MAIVRRASPLVVAAAVACFPGNLACTQVLGLDDLHARASAGATLGEGGACTSNAQCIDNSGNPAFCVSGNCVSLDTQLCLPQVWPKSIDIAKDDVELIAAFIPLNAGSALAEPYALAYQLALEELAKAGGIPGALREPRRQVAMIFCASEEEDNRVDDAKRHVAEDLRVPAVIAGFDDLGLEAWLDDHAVKNNIFTLNPSAATDALKIKNTQRLLWNLLGTAEDVAVAYRPLLVHTEKYVRNRHHSAADAPVNVALLSTDTATELSVAEVLRNGPIDHATVTGKKDPEKALVFNQLSTAENGKNGNFLYIPVNALEKVNGPEKGTPPDYGDIKKQLTAFRPDVVIAMTRDEIVKIVEDYEGAISDPAALPIWLLSYRNAHPEGLLDYLRTDFDQKRERFLGVQYAGASQPEQRDAWLGRMKDAYQGVDEASYSAVENFYDAVYWLAYGLAGAGAGAPTAGKSIGEGVRTLLAGTPIYAGPPDTVTTAFHLISDNANTAYVGALGPPDISEKFGTWNSVGGVYCYVQDDKGSIAPRYDVLRYNGSTGELDGMFDCFVTPGAF